MNSKKLIFGKLHLNIQSKQQILICDLKLIVNINYTVPKIVHANQIIKIIFDIINKNNQMLKI